MDFSLNTRIGQSYYEKPVIRTSSEAEFYVVTSFYEGMNRYSNCASLLLSMFDEAYPNEYLVLTNPKAVHYSKLFRTYLVNTYVVRTDMKLPLIPTLIEFGKSINDEEGLRLIVDYYQNMLNRSDVLSINIHCY